MAYKRGRPNHKRMLRKVRRKLNFGPPKRRFSKPKRKAVRKIAKNQVFKYLETKKVVKHDKEIVLNTALSSGVFKIDLFDPVQGDNNYERNGNRVTLTGLYANVFLHNRSISNKLVRVLILRHKEEISVAVINDLYLFQDTEGSKAKLSQMDSWERQFFPVNKLEYHAEYDRLHKLSGANGQHVEYQYTSTIGNPTVTTQVGDQATYPFSANKMVTIRKKMNKRIYFNESAGDNMVNETGGGKQTHLYSLVIIPIAANMDPSTLSTIEMSYHTMMYFKDG